MQIDGKNLCDSCFEEITGTPCPYCGYAPERYRAAVGMLPVGSMLKSRYKIGKVLGAGGFGVTYKAYDILLQCSVAIKEYYPSSIVHRDTGTTQVSVREHTMSEDFWSGAEKFCEEAKTVSRFNGNPNIVGVSDHFRENGTAYFVMEYLDGMDLKHYIAMHGGKLTQENVVHIAKVLADALIITHSLDVLHRDISPDNIFITSEGKIKLIDFGAARQVLGQQSKSLSVILKQGFAPLEQYQRKGKQGSWTDIYALGATMYYALTGKIPEDATERLEDPEIGNAEDYGVDPELWAVIDKCMAIKISDRYEETVDFKRALNKLHIQEAELEKLPKVQFVQTEAAAQPASVSEDLQTTPQEQSAPMYAQQNAPQMEQSAPMYAQQAAGTVGSPQDAYMTPQEQDEGKTVAFGAGAPVMHGAQQSASAQEQQSVPMYAQQMEQSAPMYAQQSEQQMEQSASMYAQQAAGVVGSPQDAYMTPQEQDEGKTVAFGAGAPVMHGAQAQQLSPMYEAQQSAPQMNQSAPMYAQQSAPAMSGMQPTPGAHTAAGQNRGKRALFHAVMAGLAILMAVFGVLTITRLHQKKAVPYDDMAENKYYLNSASADFSRMGMIIREMPIMRFSPGVKIEFQSCLNRLKNNETNMYATLAIYEAATLAGRENASEYGYMRDLIDRWVAYTYYCADLFATDRTGKVNYASSNADDYPESYLYEASDALMMDGRYLENISLDEWQKLEEMLNADADANAQAAEKKEKSLSSLRLAATVVLIASAALIVLLLVISTVRAGKSGGNGKGMLFNVLILILTAIMTVLGVLSLLKLGKDKKVPYEDYAQAKYYLSEAMFDSNEMQKRLRNMAVMYISPGTEIEFQDQLDRMKKYEKSIYGNLDMFLESASIYDRENDYERVNFENEYASLQARLKALIANSYEDAELIATDIRGKVNYVSSNIADYSRINVEDASYDLMYVGRSLEDALKSHADNLTEMLYVWARENREEAAKLEKSLNGLRLAALIVMIASAAAITVLTVIGMAGARRQGPGMPTASGMPTTSGMPTASGMNGMQFAPGMDAVAFAGQSKGKRAVLCALMAGFSVLMTVFGVLAVTRLHQKKAVPYEDRMESQYELSRAGAELSRISLVIREMPIMWSVHKVKIEFQGCIDRMNKYERNMNSHLALFEERMHDGAHDEGVAYDDLKTGINKWLDHTYSTVGLIATDRFGGFSPDNSNPDVFNRDHVLDGCDKIMGQGRDLFNEILFEQDKLTDILSKDADINAEAAEKKEQSLNRLRLAATVVLIVSAVLIVLLLVILQARSGRGGMLFGALILILTALMTVLGVLSLLRSGKDKKVPVEDHARAKYYLSETLRASRSMEERLRNMALMYISPGTRIEFQDQIAKMKTYEQLARENLARFSESVSGYDDSEFNKRREELAVYLDHLIVDTYEDAALIATGRSGMVDYSYDDADYYVWQM